MALEPSGSLIRPSFLAVLRTAISHEIGTQYLFDSELRLRRVSVSSCVNNPNDHNARCEREKNQKKGEVHRKHAGGASNYIGDSLVLARLSKIEQVCFWIGILTCLFQVHYGGEAFPDCDADALCYQDEAEVQVPGHCSSYQPSTFVSAFHVQRDRCRDPSIISYQIHIYWLRNISRFGCHIGQHIRKPINHL